MVINNPIIYFLFIILSLSVTTLSVRFILPKLKNRAKQPIYDGGPVWHLSKSGTPTMGGIAFILSSTVFILVFYLFTLSSGGYGDILTTLSITLAFASLNAVIGIFDDLKKLQKKQNAGLSPLEKLFFQLILAVLFLMARAHFMGDDTTIPTPLGSMELGVLYYPLCIILMLGIINCANLTDGIDGLASSVALTVGILLVFLNIGRHSAAALIGALLIGISVGFLFFNINPARIFMGDTGSLFLGALVVGSAFSAESPLLSVSLGSVYVIEGISVIMQVIYYKGTKKRLFKMAPLHHHLEKCGMNECKICLIAVITTLILSLTALMLW